MRLVLLNATEHFQAVECYADGKELQKELTEPSEQTKKLAGEKTAVRTRGKRLFFHYVTSLHAHISCTACSSHLKKDAVESETESQNY